LAEEGAAPLSGAAAHPVFLLFRRTAAVLEVLFSVRALIGSVVLSGLIALISLFGTHILLICIGFFVPSSVPLFVGKIGPIVTVVVIWHFSIPPQALFCSKGF
jgi:hypothetical protein